MPNPAREASVTILATRVSAWSKMHTESSPVRDGTTRELVLCRPYGTGPATLDRFHGLTPVARIVTLASRAGLGNTPFTPAFKFKQRIVLVIERGRKARDYMFLLTALILV